MRAAEAIMIQRDPTALDQLRPLRLRMAGEITGCQLAFHRRIGAGNPRSAAAVRLLDDWNDMGARFRAFTAAQERLTPECWRDYVGEARTNMRLIRNLIGQIRTMLVDLDAEAPSNPFA